MFKINKNDLVTVLRNIILLIKTSKTEVYTISKLINLIKTEINIVIYNKSIDIEEIKPVRPSLRISKSKKLH
jgi:hypothetical protein